MYYYSFVYYIIFLNMCNKVSEKQRKYLYDWGWTFNYFLFSSETWLNILKNHIWITYHRTGKTTTTTTTKHFPVQILSNCNIFIKLASVCCISFLQWEITILFSGLEKITMPDLYWSYQLFMLNHSELGFSRRNITNKIHHVWTSTYGYLTESWI